MCDGIVDAGLDGAMLAGLEAASDEQRPDDPVASLGALAVIGVAS